MKIVKCGYNYRHPADFALERPYGSGDFLLLVLRSPAYFVLDGVRQIAMENSVIIFEKGKPQIYGAFEKEFINDWVHFQAEPDDLRQIDSLGLVFNRLISVFNVSSLSSLIRNICKEKHSNDRNSEAESILYLKLLLMKFSDLCNIMEHVDNPVSYEKLSKLRNDIYTNPQKEWKVEEMARETLISLSYFQHQYKNFFGVSMKKDLTIARMELAKHLLFSTDYGITSISRLCGYENDVHFMRMFKNYTGLTPTEYRKSSVIFSRKM